MKSATIQLAAVLFFISFSPGLPAQDEIVYTNPELGIQFIASSNWTRVILPDDDPGYEFVNLNNNMQVKLWFSKTDIPVLDYLSKEISNEGNIALQEPFAVTIDDHQAYGICSNCLEMRKPFQVMLIALPTDNGMYLFRFKCPEDCYSEHKKQIEEFLAGISLGMIVERNVFYAYNI